jgi:hypothetical protein
VTLSCAGQRGWGSSKYIHTSQKLGGQLSHILQQVADKLYKVPDAKAKSPLICEQWGAEYCMFHGIDGTDPTGVSIVLLPNQDCTQVPKLSGKHTAQPRPEPLMENLQIITLACVTSVRNVAPFMHFSLFFPLLLTLTCILLS